MTIPASDRPVVLYKAVPCPYCSAALRFLRERKGVLDHQLLEIDLSGDGAARQALATASGQRTVPQIWIGGVHVGGYDDMRALDARGELDPLLARALGRATG